MYKPFLSVVVITKDQAWNIRRLLDSVLTELEAWPSAEVILADSASADETVSIASTFPGVKIARLRGEQRLTPAAGRYVGFHHSTGDLILFLDGDTELIPGWLRIGIDLLQTKSEVAGVGGIFIDLLKDAPVRSASDIPASANSLHDMGHLSGCVCLYRRVVLEQVGGFNPYLYSEEEAELALRIRRAGYRLIEIQRPAVFHRQADQPQTLSNALARSRRRLLYGGGQVLRQLFGTPLFLTFARERGRAFIPLIAMLAGVSALATTRITNDSRWIEGFVVIAIGGFFALAIRKHSLYQAVRSVVAHMLLLEGTIAGAFVSSPPSDTYLIDDLEQATRPTFLSTAVNQDAPSPDDLPPARESVHNRNPFVTVVIPTRNRPELVVRAVRSALLQTVTDLEVIVVVDGPDPCTVSALEFIQRTDARLRVVALPQNVGGSDARNAGIEYAVGEWIALLDDDDEWLPQKLEKQLALGKNSSHRFPVISCEIIGRTPTSDYIAPQRRPFLPFADYAWGQRGLFRGEGALYCPTLVGPRSLFKKCLFTSGLRRHQDWDWLIRAFALPGAGLEFVSEPLVICHFEEDRGSVSSTTDWRYSLNWVNRMQSYVVPESYAAFLLTSLSYSAAQQGDWSAFVPLLVSSFRRGKPRAIHLAMYFGTWLLPMRCRRFIRSITQGRPK